MMEWLIAALIVVLIVAYLAVRRVRDGKGFSPGKTLDLDGHTLYSERLGLTGRPDRIVRQNGMSIPEEWKSAMRVHDSHRAQLGVYFLLIEDDTGVRPTHGFIVLKTGERVSVTNTLELRRWVLAIADQVRAARRNLDQPIPVRQPPAKCRACGIRNACAQRSS